MALRQGAVFREGNIVHHADNDACATQVVDQVPQLVRLFVAVGLRFDDAKPIFAKFVSSSKRRTCSKLVQSAQLGKFAGDACKREWLDAEAKCAHGL